METYYTKKEYNEMKSILTRKLTAAEKKLKKAEQKIEELEHEIAVMNGDEVDVVVTLDENTPEEEETHVTED